MGAFYWGGKFFAYASRFITGILLARFLAAEQYGLYNLSLTVIEIAAGLGAMGLAAALVRYIPIFVSQRDEKRIWGMIQLGLGLPTLLSLLLGIGLYTQAEFVAEQLFAEPNLTPLLKLLSPLLVFFTLGDMIAAATRGFKNVHYTVIAQDIAKSTVKFVLILALVIVGLNTTGSVVIIGLTEVLTCLLLLFFLNKQFSLKRPLLAAKREVGEVLRFSLPGYFAGLTTTFSSNIRTLLLGTLHDVTAVGVFAAARQVNLISDMFHTSIVTVSQPIVAELSSRPNKEQLKGFYQTMSRWSFILNLPFFCLIILFSDAILHIFGESFADGVVVLRILAWAGLINTSTGICGVLLDMSGNTHLKLVNTIVSVATSIGLSFLMIPSWGLMGAATASLASAVIVNLLRLVEVFMIFRLLPYNPSFLKPIIAGFIAFGVDWGFDHWLLGGVSPVYLVVKVIIFLSIYISLMLALGLSDEDRMVLARLRQRFGLFLPKRQVF
ncbi:MAG: flippase [Anaerolineales bacterium]|nr:flippase [Anaerolineales bacterium]